MTKIACVADVHVWNHQKHGGHQVCGLNDRARLCLTVLNRALRQARVESADYFVVAGDLVDHWNCEPQLLAALQVEFSNQPFIVQLLAGNHDRQSYRGGDHALGVFQGADVYDYPTHSHNATFIPAPPKDAGDDWLELALNEAWPWPEHAGSYENSLLVLHAGIADSQTPKEWTEGSSRHIHVDLLAELCDAYGIKAVVAGDWHQHKSWQFDNGLEVMQIGALCPKGWADAGLKGYGSVVYWDSSLPVGRRLSRREIPGPRFVTVQSQEEMDKLAHSLDHADKLFVRSTKPVIPVGKSVLEVVPELEKHVQVEVVADVSGVREYIRESVFGISSLGREEKLRLVDRCIKLIEQG